MTAIVMSVDIACSPEEVFSYVTDPARLPDWQESVVSAHRYDNSALAIGSRSQVTRRVGPREQPTTVEVIELNPPRSWATRVIDGPIRGIEKGMIEPLEAASDRGLQFPLISTGTESASC
jgi:uncharacterized protein YndB with AHSA1/START domain